MAPALSALLGAVTGTMLTVALLSPWLSARQLDLAKAQLQSDDPGNRVKGLLLAARSPDQSFAVDAAAVYAFADPDARVQKTAGFALSELYQTANPKVRQEALHALQRYVRKQLEAADSYLVGSDPSGVENALRAYRDVLDVLPYAELRKVDQRRVRVAQDEQKLGRVDSALRSYRAAFATYVEASDSGQEDVGPAERQALRTYVKTQLDAADGYVRGGSRADVSRHSPSIARSSISSRTRIFFGWTRFSSGPRVRMNERAISIMRWRSTGRRSPST